MAKYNRVEDILHTLGFHLMNTGGGTYVWSKVLLDDEQGAMIVAYVVDTHLEQPQSTRVPILYDIVNEESGESLFSMQYPSLAEFYERTRP